MRFVNSQGFNVFPYNDIPRGKEEWLMYLGCKVCIPKRLTTEHNIENGVSVHTIRHSTDFLQGVLVSASDTHRYDERIADDVLIVIETEDKVFHLMKVSMELGYILELDSFDDML